MLRSRSDKANDAPAHIGKGTSMPFFSKYTSHADSHEAAPFFQAKLTIGQPGDKYEQEADAVADKVVQRFSEPQGQGDPIALKAPAITPAIQAKCATCDQEEKLQKKEEAEKDKEQIHLKEMAGNTLSAPPGEDDDKHVQRKCEDCEKEERLQKKDSGTGSMNFPGGLATNLNTSKGGGSPLPGAVQTNMGHVLGADLSNVRIHTGSNAVQMSRELNAQAFTHKNDIYFNSGKYDPSSKSGQHLLAHELTHTVQQGKAGQIQQKAAIDNIGVQFLQLPRECNTINRKAEKLNISDTSADIQKFEMPSLSLSGIAGYFNIKLPGNPVEAIQIILSLLESTEVKMAFAMFPAYEMVIMELNLALKVYRLFQSILSQKEKIIAEIKKFLEKKIDDVTPIVKEKLRDAFAGFDKRHYDVIWNKYLYPMLAHLKDNWWETIKGSFWEQIWPFEGLTTMTDAAEKRTGLGKELGEIWDHIKQGFNELKGLHFSKFLDQILQTQKAIMSVVNRFYGMISIIIIASETIAGTIAGAAAGGIGAVPGAAVGFGAGLETAGVLGELLLLTTIAVDTGVLLKSIYSLRDFDKALADRKILAENHQYYLQIANSGISIGVAGAFLVLASLGGRLAKLFLSRVTKFLPESVEEILTYIKKGMKGEKPGAKEEHGSNTNENTEQPGRGTGKEVVKEGPSQDGERKLQIDKDGNCLVCASPCEHIRKKYKNEITPDVDAEITAIEKQKLSPSDEYVAMKPIEEKLANIKKAKGPNVTGSGHELTKNVASALEKANPGSVEGVDVIIKDANGNTLTDFDVVLKKHIIEVTRGNAKSKVDQITENIIPNAGGKEVVYFNPEYANEVEKALAKAGIKAFNHIYDLIKYVNGVK